jgi:hypothetical protein
MKNYTKFIITFVVGLAIATSTFSLAYSDFIPSDWKLESEEDKKPPVSALELEQREAKIKALETKKKAEAEEMERTKEDIQERRKVLIKCMKDRGVVLYSIEDCPACKEQKAYFGDDFSSVQYVDCKKNPFTCPLTGIKTYPTWYLGRTLGIKKEGSKDLPTLARLTGCDW